ncbi:oligosaccharide flippase family protein, partial [Cobetia marina]
MHAISNAAVVPALVQAGRDGYERLCRDAYWFNWVVCLGLMVLQMALAPLLAYLYDAPDLTLPLMALALIFPMLPPAAINAARILRSNRLHVTARIEMGQSIGEALGVMLLAAMGAGFWALILPKLIVTPIWTLSYRWCESWRIDERPSTLWSHPLMRFARPMMGVEVVSVLRQQMDY